MICNVATLPGDSFAWQQVSVQHGQVGKFKVLDLLDSAVLEHGQVGSCAGSWAASGASELGWFDQCS